MGLSELPVLVVDCQTTGSTPDRDHLLEIAWAMVPAPGRPVTVHSFLLALPEGAVIPARISRITGLTEDSTRGVLSPEEVKNLLLAAIEDRTPVAHFAVFERRWLDHLFTGSRSFSDIICTRELARRLYPGLPRKGLRPVAGHLGYDMEEARRSGDHVRATVFIWKAIVAELDTMGVGTLEELKKFLDQPPPAHRGSWEYSLPREKRLALPDHPGVYRLLSCDGRVLYAGKATSLKRRVNSYFTRRRADGKTLELVSRVCSVDVSPTETSLESALEEIRTIREHDPPYNIALRERGVALVHLSRDLSDVSTVVDEEHPVGPLKEGSMAAMLSPMLNALVGEGGQDAVKLGLDRLPLASGALQEGLEIFRDTHAGRTGSIGALLSLGGELWRLRAIEDEEVTGETDPDESGKSATEIREDPAEMNAAAVLAYLESVVSIGSRDVRRAACMRLLGWSMIRWTTVAENRARWLLMLEGSVHGAGWFGETDPLEHVVPQTLSRSERQMLLTPMSCDLLGVLLSELRRVSSTGRLVGIDLLATGASLGITSAKRLLDSL